jgi:hypothetical protein
MAMKWIVRATQAGIAAADANDSPIILDVGQRGWVNQGEALAAALRGAVDMLSPDGVDALEAAQRGTVKPDGVQTQTQAQKPPVPEAEAHAPEGVAPMLTSNTGPLVGNPAPSVAPPPRRHGPQLKMPVPGA